MTRQEIMVQLKDYWNNHRLCSNVNKYIPKGSQVDLFLQEQLDKYPWFQTKKRVITCFVNGIYQPLKCKRCGNIISLDNALQGKVYCSVKCAQNSESTLNRRKETNIKNLGCEFPAQNKSSKEKFKKTMIEKYGAEYSLQSKQIREKYKKTMQEKYNCVHPFYSQQIKNTFKQTMINRYGCDHPSKIKELRQKSSKKQREEGYNLILSKWNNYVVPLFTLEEYKGHKRGIIYKWKCVKCNNVFQQEIYTTGLGKSGNIPRCEKCYPYHTSSLMEKEIVIFIRSIYSKEIILNSRQIINPYQIDIYLPEKQFAIEFDGFYWHNDKSGKNKDYHIMKTQLCQQKGIQLIHIFEDEWIKYQNIVKDRIKSLLGIYDRKIYARKCVINEISTSIKNKFLQENHIQGVDSSSVKLGLYYNDELVAVMTFGKPRFNKKYDFQLIRYASRLGTQVIGGCSKLLKHFVKHHANVSIISYADRRFSTGKLYKSIGFELVGKSQPNYWWCKNKVKLSRYQCQKYKLKNILGDKFDKNLTEEENMRLNDFDKVYDCGNLIYLYKKLYNKK